MTDQTWNPLLRDQLAWHWANQLRERLDGLTDDERSRRSPGDSGT